MIKHKMPKVDDSNSGDNILEEDILYNEEGLSKCNPSMELGKKRSWTADEDAYLMKLVQKYGAQKWTSIAEHLPGILHLMQGRIGKQCR